MRNHLLIFCTILAIYGCNSANMKSFTVPEEDLRPAEAAFTELKEMLDADNGKMWNHSLHSPLMLVNKETRTFVANQQDADGRLKKQGDFYTGMLPENINIANTAFDWNGKRWTMVFLPLPETKEERLRLLIHESFHNIQPVIGFDSLREIPCTHLDTKEGRILLRLEMEALKQALLSDTPEQHINNALLFRHFRHQYFQVSQVAESSLEIIEGVAEYTGLMLSGMTGDALRDHLVSQTEALVNLPTYVRSFAYYEFPVYGFFMRQKDETWHLKINKNTDLTDLISGLFGVEYPELTMKDVTRVGKEYNIDKITASEEKRELIRLELVKTYTVRFLGDSIVRLSLENMSIGFNPSNLMPLDTFGTVYPNMRITDNWGILEVDSCGALLSPDWRQVTISYPDMITDTLISGNGWRLRLNNGWKLEKEGAGYRVTQ